MSPVAYIVDDDESARRGLTRLVNCGGIEARSFASAREFLDAKCQDEDACLVADVKMPEMSGLDLCRALSDAGAGIPVILITAYDTSENREAAMQAGAVAYLRKPVDGRALLDAVRWALAHAHPRPPQSV